MAESRRKGIRLVIILCVVVALAVTGVLIWTSRRATVRFYSEQGALDSMSVSIGGTIEQPKDPIAKDKGYAFGGWYSDPGFTTEFDFDLPIERDTTIYVKWVERTFTVTVVRVTNTGSFNEVLWSSSGRYKSTIALPTKDTTTTYQDLATPKYNFQRANQTFIGFATRPNASGDFGYQYLPGADFTIPNDSIFLYAIFRGAESSFIFNPNSADGETKNETGYFNEYFTVPSSEGLSKQYYSFAYWCTGADGVPRDSDGFPCDINSPNCVNVFYPGQTFKVTNTTPLTLYAIWERNLVNVMLDARGGLPTTGADRTNLVDAGLAGGYDLSLITPPTKDGFRLMGYNTQETGLGTSYAIDDVIEIGEEDITLYAIWARELTIGYSLNNSKVSDEELGTDYADFVGIDGEVMTILGLPVTVDVQNFTFLGWSLDAAASSADYHAGDEFTLREADFENADKLVLNAIWRGDSRTLKLKNTADNQIQEISSYFGRQEKLATSAIHTDTNYYFVGWGTIDNYDYKNPGNYTGSIYTLGQNFEMGSNTEPGQANDILYSLWCPYSYTVTYYMQGGELTIAPGEPSYVKEYVYKERATLYSSVQRVGYRFMGWSYSANSTECAFYDNEEGTGYTLEMPGNSFQLYAVWSKEYTITFQNNAADATGLVTPITGIILGETFTIPTEAVSNSSVIRDNYSIVAWATKPENGTEFEFGATITLEQSDMVVFYAIWKGDQRNIEVYDGGSLLTTIEGQYGTDILLVFDGEVENDDPGYEIGGFYALLEQNVGGTIQENRYDLAYGGYVKTTGIYFLDKNSRPVDTLKVFIIWNKKYFTITYELNGGIYDGNEDDDMSGYRIYDQYTNVVTLAPLTPEKNRYEFKGWTEDVDNPVDVYPAGSEYSIPARNVTLYALWARIYTLSFSSNGGDLATGQTDLTSQSYARGTRITVPNSPYEKPHYAFDTWNTRADGQGTSYGIGTSLEITADVTLYAIWLGRQVQLTLIATDPDDAGYTYQQRISPDPRYGDTVSIGTYASSISAPNGLQLKGWKLDQPSGLDEEVDYTNDYVVDQDGAVQLYAVWAPKSYYFIIVLNGGVYNKTYNDYSVPTPYRTTIDLATYSSGAAPITREGYRLLGFANNAEATVPTYSNDATFTMPAESKKIYCVWQELTVITFDKNCEDESLEDYIFNGVVGDPALNTVDLEDVNSKFSRSNYTLLGWSTSSTATVADASFAAGTPSYRIQDTNDIYLYAVWEGRTIQVRFNNNPAGGGSSNVVQEERKYGDVIDLTATEYIRNNSNPGFIFGGWSLTSGENNNGGIVGNTYTVSTANDQVSVVELYAIWTKKFFTLTYDYGDSSLGSKANPDGFDTRNVEYTSTVDVSTFVNYAKNRLGYDFLGWAENVGETDPAKIYGRPGTPNPTNLTFTMPNYAMTLHALWSPIYVPVTFKSNTPAGATETWVGVGAATSYTAANQYLYQLSFTLPTNVIKTGISVHVTSYRFVGWIVEGDTSNTVRLAGENFQINVREYLVLIAQWEENIISVIVNANGGIITDKSSQTATYSVKETEDFEFLTGSQITRAGYRLVSYTIKNTTYDISTVSRVQITVSLMLDEDVSSNTVRMTANWIKQITVSFNANGEYGETITGSIADMKFDAGSSINLPNCTATEGYQRQYYKFVGWNEYSDGSGTTFNAGDTFTTSYDLPLYAVWEGNDRTVVLHYSTNQVGTAAGENVSTKTISNLKYGAMLDSSLYGGTCTNDAGYKLEGWTTLAWTPGMSLDTFVVMYTHTSKIKVGGSDANPEMHLYAVWVARAFRITYNANGGIFYSDGTSTTLAGPTTQYGESIDVSSGKDGTYWVKNPSSTISFYEFVGWSIDSSFSYNNADRYPSAYDFPSASCIYTNSASATVKGFKMPTNDVVLYAVWSPVAIQVQYYKEATDATAYHIENITYGTTITMLEGVTKADNNFGNWVHVDTDKTTVIEKYKAGINLKIYNTTMSDEEEKLVSKKIMFIAEWVPQTVYVQINCNGGAFSDGTTSRIFESSVGRKFTLPAINDASNKIVFPYYALVNFKADNAPAFVYTPGQEITIPTLGPPLSPQLKAETITLENGETISTYVYPLSAQWVEAEAYIYLSDNEEDNPYYATLGEAIADADSGRTVKIIRDCYVKSEIVINKQITIGPDSDSEGITYNIFRYVDTENSDNSYKGVLFNVGSDGMLTVGEDTDEILAYTIVFDGKNTSYACASIFNVFGTLRLYNGSVVRGNKAENGGAITLNSANASASIKYASFESNSATTNGGAIYVALGSNVEIKNSTFTQNLAGHSGGAVYNNKTMNLVDNTFTLNKANNPNGGGGAIYNNGGTISDSTNVYLQNSTTGKGGAICNNGGYTITSSSFKKNNALSSGGAIHNMATTSSSENLVIITCAFGASDDNDSGNYTNNYGGAISNVGKLSISETTFNYNKANLGGAIMNDETTSTLLLQAVIFNENQADNGSGGAVAIQGGVINIGEAGVASSSVTFGANTVKDGKGHSLAVIGSSNVSVHFATFTGLEYDGSASDGGVVYQSQGIMTLYNVTIYENKIVNGYGGGMLIAGGTCEVKGAAIYSNEAKYGGAIAVASNGNVIIHSAEIYNNQAECGGGIYIKDSNSKVELKSNTSGGSAQIGTVDSGNSATNEIAAISNGGGIFNNGTLTISGGVVQNNAATGNGGGIYNAGTVNLVSGSILTNACAMNGGAIYSANNGIVKFSCSTTVMFLIEGNLCANGAYPLGDYGSDSSNDYYANGIYITNTKVVISGYIVIGMNSDETIINEIYLSQRVGNVPSPTKIIEWGSDSAASLSDYARICIGSKVAGMGDKLVKFPSSTTGVNSAKTNLPKFSFAGDDAGFRVDGLYLILGNYAAIIDRGGTEPEYYQSLTEAYLDAADGEVIMVAKNINLAKDLETYNSSEYILDGDKTARELQTALLSGITIDKEITETFYISKRVTITSEAEYTISRGGLEGDMFTIVGEGQLTLGEASPAAGISLIIKGDIDVETGSIIRVDTPGAGLDPDAYQLIVDNGVKLTKNQAQMGAAIYSDGRVQIKGGEITDNLAKADDGGLGGGIYSTNYLNITGKAKITKNEAFSGGGIYIKNTDSAVYAMNIDNKDVLISENKVTNAGGGVYIFGGKVKISAGSISTNYAAVSNSAGLGGGGIYVFNGVENTILEIASSSPTNSTQTTNIQIANNESETDGGGIVLDNTTLEFSNGYIQGNKANSKGGGIALINSAGLATPAAVLNTTNTSYYNWIQNNIASNGGGISNKAGTINLGYIKIKGNQAYADGGAIYNESILNLNTGTYIGQSGSDGANIAANNGGGIANTKNGIIDVLSQTAYVCYNQAGKYGGGIANSGTFKNTYYVEISGNRASVGGGFANIDSTAVANIDYLQFYSNTATSKELGGGGIYNAGRLNFVLKRSHTYIGGDAASKANRAFNGGGIYNDGSIVIKRSENNSYRVLIRYNEAEIYGGGIYNAGSIENHWDNLTSVTCSLEIVNNKTTTTMAGGGGGICNNGGTINGLVLDSIPEPLKTHNFMYNVYINYNQTGGYGGGLLLLDGTVTQVDFMYQQNVASLGGGAVAVVAGEFNEGHPSATRRYGRGTLYYRNEASTGSTMYLQSTINFYSYLTSANWYGADYGEGIYLANTRSYLIFHVRPDVEKTSYYVGICNVNVNDITDGRRIAKFGSYVSMEPASEDSSEMIEVTVYYADSYYTNFRLGTSQDGWGLSVDDKGFVVISEPVAMNLETGKKYSTIAAAVADIKAGNTGYIWIMKSHTVDQQVLVVDKSIEFLCSSNIILTASKKLGSNPMFFIFSSYTDLNTRTSKYTVRFNYSRTGYWANRNGTGKWGKAAEATLTIDGNKSMYKYTAFGYGAIMIRSGAYRKVEHTYTDNQTKTISKPYSTTWGYGTWNLGASTCEGLYMNGSLVQYIAKTDNSGNVRGTTNYGSHVNTQPAIYDVYMYYTDIINVKSYIGGAVGAVLYTDETSTYSSKSGYLEINDCNFENNYSARWSNGGTSYTYYANSEGGAAVNATGGRVNIYRTKFINNWSCCSGGALVLKMQQYNADINEHYPVWIEECSFEGNIANNSHGGAIMMAAVQGIVILRENSFIGNQSYSGGGAVYYYPATDKLSNLLSWIGYPMNNSFPGYGTGYYAFNHDTTYNSKSYLYVEATNTFSSNIVRPYTWFDGTATTHTGTSNNNGGAIYATNNLRVYAATFSDNIAAGGGGAIYCGRYAYFDGTTFTNNVAQTSHGGAIRAEGCDMKYFNNIKAVGNSSPEDGGALYMHSRGGTLSVTGGNTLFENNSAKRGGAIWYYRYIPWISGVGYDYANQNASKVQIEVLAGTFQYNSADTHGGAFYIDPRSSGTNTSGGTWAYTDLRAFIWNGVIITNNKAGTAGGGVYAIYNLVLYNVMITDNEVTEASSGGGGAGVFANNHLDIIMGAITGNAITAESGNAMGGGGVRVGGRLSLGAGYSSVNSYTESTIRQNYYSTWQGAATGSSHQKKLITKENTVTDQYDDEIDSSVTLYRMIYSSNDENAVKISDNICQNSEGVSNAQGTGVYTASYIYFEARIGITDEVYTTNYMFVWSQHIWFRDIIKFYYGGTISEGKTAIYLHRTNDIITEEVARMQVLNSSYTLTWKGGSKSAYYQIMYTQSTLTVEVYANGFDNSGNAITGAQLSDGRDTMIVAMAYGDMSKILYDQVVPTKEGYSFYYFRYFRNNDVDTYKANSSNYWSFGYNDSSMFNESNLKSRVPVLNESGGRLKVYIIWRATEYTITMNKKLSGTTTVYPSYMHTTASYISSNYTYKVNTGESLESVFTDFEEEQSLASGCTETKAYLKGYILSYYQDYSTKKTWSKDTVYPYPYNTTVYAVYVKEEYTLTFTAGEGATLLTDKNVLKVKYGNVTTMLSGNLVSKSGHRVVGWIDNNGTEYNLTSTYTITQNLTLTPKWQAIPYDLRLYYNFPDGGTSFMLYPTYAGSDLITALNSFSANPTGYTLRGFSYDAAGEQPIESGTLMPGENTIVYAQWAPKTVTLTFYDVENKLINSYTVDCLYGSEYVLPEMPASSLVKLWENQGSGIYYTPGSSFLIASEETLFLRFYAVAG